MTRAHPSYLVIALALLGAIIACGCMAAEKAGGGPADRIAGNGTITYVDLEGGFYGIVADNGERYLPASLPAEFQQDGLRVTFVVEPSGETATIQQWGTPVEVIAIDEAENATYVATTGTVTYVDLEGGFYGIVADDGEDYLPLNLNETYRVDGTRITFAGEIARDTVTIQQWGTPVEIIAVL